MHLTQTGWWWSIKHKLPDPFSPTTGTKRWAYQKIKNQKQITDPLLIGLIAASTIANEQIPTFALGSTPLHRHLHKYANKNGYLQTQKLTGTDMDILRQVLAEEPHGLLTEDDSMMLIFDSGATITTTYNEADFKPGSLEYFKDGEIPPVQGIAGSLPIKGRGTMSPQVINNKGELVDIETTAYYIPDLQTKLFSLQAYFVERNDDLEFILR